MPFWKQYDQMSWLFGQKWISKKPQAELGVSNFQGFVNISSIASLDGTGSCFDVFLWNSTAVMPFQRKWHRVMVISKGVYRTAFWRSSEYIPVSCRFMRAALRARAKYLVLSSQFVEDVQHEICLSVGRRQPYYLVTWCKAHSQTCPCRLGWHVLFLECESTTLTGLYFTMDSRSCIEETPR